MSKKEEQKPQGHSVNIPHSTEPQDLKVHQERVKVANEK